MTKSWRDFLLETQKTFVRKKPITLFFLLGEVCLKESEDKETETNDLFGWRGEGGGVEGSRVE